jgi:hypothetical protein
VIVSLGEHLPERKVVMLNTDQAQDNSALLFILLFMFSLAWGVAVTVPGIVFPKENLLSKESYHVSQ